MDTELLEKSVRAVDPLQHHCDKLENNHLKGMNELEVLAGLEALVVGDRTDPVTLVMDEGV